MKTRSLVMIAALVLACGEEGLGPSNISVNSQPDRFMLQILSVTQPATEVLTYNWVNNGTQANIDVSQSVTAGAALLTVRDADGNSVLQDDIANDNDTDSAVGTPGTWTVSIDFQGMTGGFTITLERRN